jgi:hypothetical protein
VTKIVDRRQQAVMMAGTEWRASPCDRATSHLERERAASGLLPLLLAAKAFAHHLIRRRCRKAGADPLAVAMPLSPVGNAGAISAAR